MSPRIVRVVGREDGQEPDATYVAPFVGRLGIVKAIDTRGIIGEREDDPLHLVRFADGTTDVFWTEEIEDVQSGGH